MKKKDYFIPKMFYRMLIPSICSSFGLALADMADAFAVGQKLGPTGLAAISLCLPVFMLINIFMDGFGLGGSIYFSQKLGEGNNNKAIDCFNRIWTAELAIGVLIALSINLFMPQCMKLLGASFDDKELYKVCEEYLRIIAWGAPLLMLNVVFASFLRNDNNANLSTAGFIIGNAIDIMLNIILVVFFDMGTKGAALSTVIGSAAAIIIYLPGILGKKADILKVRYVKPDIKETFSCFITGFSTSIQNLFQLIFFLAVNRLLMNLAGESGVAIFDVVYNISFFIIYLYNGTAEAAQPLISAFCGENSENDCRYILRLSRYSGIGMGAAVSAAIYIFAHDFAVFFGITAELLPLSVNAVRIYCIGFAFIGLNIINEQYYQSKDIIGSAFFIVLMRGFAVLIPALIIFSFLGIKFIWLAFPVTEIVTLILFYIYKTFFAKKEVLFDSKRILQMTVENDDIGELLNQSFDFCEKWNADSQQKYYVTLVIEEICMYIVRNAMKNIPDGKIRITLQALENGDFVLNLLDNAVVFNPFLHKSGNSDADADFNIDNVSMMMIKKKSKEFMYRRCSGFNSLVVRI